MVPRYSFHVMIYWADMSRKVKIISFDTLPTAMACYSENIGRTMVASVEVSQTLHVQSNPTAHMGAFRNR